MYIACAIITKLYQMHLRLRILNSCYVCLHSFNIVYITLLHLNIFLILKGQLYQLLKDCGFILCSLTEVIFLIGVVIEACVRTKYIACTFVQNAYHGHARFLGSQMVNIVTFTDICFRGDSVNTNYWLPAFSSNCILIQRFPRYQTAN